MKRILKPTAQSLSALSALGLALGLTLAAGAAHAQAWPAKPIRLIVPYAAGGYYDLVARVTSPRLSEQLGQAVVVENRAGANGMIGTDFVAKSAPDGYTILIGGIGPNALNAILYPKLPYDPVRDFAPIIGVSYQPSILVVHPTLGVNSVRELIALARTRPLNYASAGAGSSPHLATEMLNGAMGLKIAHVPYKGSGPAAAAALAGEVEVYIGAGSDILPHIRAGKLRALGVANAKRLAILPDVPTMHEAGVPNFQAGSWFGFFAPTGTAQPVIGRLNAEFTKILSSPVERDRVAAGGSADITIGTPEQLGDLVKSEIAKWSAVIRDANIRVE